MSSAAVLSPSMSNNSIVRPSVSGSRKHILARIQASPLKYGNQVEDRDSHAQPIPISNTDALLRSRKASDASATQRPGSAHARSRSKSNASSFTQAKNGSASPTSGSYRSNKRTSKAASPIGDAATGDHSYLSLPIRRPSNASGTLRRITSNLSQRSASNAPELGSGGDDRSISSHRSSKGSGFGSLIRRRSRASSAIADASSNTSYEPNSSTPSRIRTFSGTARKMSLKLNMGQGNGSSASLSPADRESVSPASGDDTLPVSAVPETHRGSVSSVRQPTDGYKTIQSPVSVGDDSASGTPRSRKFGRQQSGSPASPDFKDPFARADGLLARARSKSNGSANRPRRGSAPVGKQKSPAPADEADVDEANEESQNASSGPIALVTSAAATTSAAVAGMLLGKSNGTASQQQDDDDEEENDNDDDETEESSEDEFHDAEELANITEGEEEDDEPTLRRSLSGRSHSSGRSANGKVRSAESKDSASSKLRGTAGASRRAGAVTGADAAKHATTPADAKIKGDIPKSIQDKAARVAKLSLDDVRINSTQLREDIEVARGALNLFLNSRMLEAEKIVEKHSDRRLYYALGAALIATIKGFMTFEPTDLAVAISLCKDSLTIANVLRKPTSSVANFGRFVRGTGQSPSSLASMDIVQKHAELVYAESLLLKAVLGIVYAGDFFAFVSEALNMRNACGIYRSLSKFVEWGEEKGSAAEGEIDEDFKSGIYLGNGLISMILGLLPGKVLKIMEVFGYSGDTAWALKTLSKAGGWSTDSSVQKPSVLKKDEGVRRQICDMSLLLYHLVISTFIPVNGVDINFADKVLHYNLKRYPEGVFFLYFSGRLYSTQALLEKAITQFETARDVQEEYVQLKHICVWDLSLCHMSMCQWKDAHDSFKILAEENNWSKAVYTYGQAATLYESTDGEDDAEMQKAADMFRKVPGLMQKIAGKSIPMEKFVARKAKKFAQYNRLLLPGLEFSYVYHCLSNAPRYILADKALVLVSDALAELHEVEDPSRYYSGEEYFDDLALAHFLRGVCLKFIAFPEPHSKVRPKESPIPEDEGSEQAEISFKTVLENGAKLKLDHWIVYFAHYELGRLYASMGRMAEAKEQLNLVLSQKNLEDRGRKGKYSLQNMVHLRANGALNAIEGK